MENQEGITFGDIFHIIRKRLWVVIAVTLACALLFFCLVQFLYNPGNRDYRFSYLISFPGLSDSVYPDGSAYRATDMISQEALQSVKERGGEDFSSVDIEKMVEDGEITIAQQSAGKDASSSLKEDVNVTLTVSGKYFSSAEQAREFLKEIAYYSIDQIQKLVSDISYDTYLKGFMDQNAETYEQKVNYLISQRTYLLNMYDSLISLKNKYYIVSVLDDAGVQIAQTLDAYQKNCEAVFNDSAQKNMLDELEVNGYIFNLASYKEELKGREEVLKGQISNIDSQIENYQAILEKYEQESNEGLITSVQNKILDLTNEKVSLQLELTKVESDLALTEEANQERNRNFETRLNMYYEQLEKQTQILKSVRTQFYEKESYLLVQNSKFVVENGFSPILAAVGGLVVGFFAVDVIVCLIDYPKYKKEKYGSVPGSGPQEPSDPGQDSAAQ